MEKRYRIELSEEQLILIAHAVEDWHRFIAGQCDLHHAVSCCYSTPERMRKLQEILNGEIHPLVAPELPQNATYGWSGSGCPNRTQRRAIAMSYGIYREILHFLTINDKDHTDWSCYDSETLTCEDTGGLIKIEEI